MIYALIFALVLLCVWLAYRLGSAHAQPAVTLQPSDVNIDIKVIKAVIERYGWTVTATEPEKTDKPTQH